MIGSAQLSHEVADRGFRVLDEIVPAEVVEHLLRSVDSAHLAVTRSRGIRNLVSRVPEVTTVAESPAVRGLAEAVLDGPATLVRSILFDKVVGANWAIRWHQDKTIAVRERIDVEGYGPWSVKDGVVSVQPPESVLDRIVSVRLHLDDCGEENGALRVIPGSHRLGKLGPEEQDRCVAKGPEHVCEAAAGGVLVMKPLLLHASSPSSRPSHRRIVHLDFATGELDGGLEWNLGA